MSQRSPTRIVLALAIVTLLVGSGLLGYRWFTASTEVTGDQALDRFRSGQAGTAARVTPEPTPAPTTPTPVPEGTSGSRATVSAPTPTPVPTPAPPPTGPQGIVLLPPEEGVYEWKTEGSEQVGPCGRDLPERSRRIVTVEGERTWMNDHIYAEQHEEWFPLTVSDQGVSSASYRAKIACGPISQDETMRFEPPLRFSVFPFEVGQQWQGSWQDPEGGSGTYTGRTFEHTTLHIGGEPVEVWGVEVNMQMEGDVSGTVKTRIWVAPQHRMTVKEYYDQQVSSGVGTYEGEWTITLLSLHPQR